ncbi:MAG: hypothetical protein V1776_01950 [Candidatus Diapherotrites archaeon]
MQAVIEIESLSQDWKPPFQKRKESKSVTINEGETFETLKNGSPLFALHSIQGGRALLEYNRAFSLKGYEHPTERVIWLDMHSPVKFSSLWEDNGTTKTITLRSIKGSSSDEESPSGVQVVEETPRQGMATILKGDNVTSSVDTEISRPSA